MPMSGHLFNMVNCSVTDVKQKLQTKAFEHILILVSRFHRRQYFFLIQHPKQLKSSYSEDISVHTTSW